MNPIRSITMNEDIDGADFYGEDSQTRVLTALSANRAFLAVVFQRRDQFFRIQIYARGKELNYGGPMWATIGDPSITDTLSNAEAIAQARLAEASNEEL